MPNFVRSCHSPLVCLLPIHFPLGRSPVLLLLPSTFRLPLQSRLPHQIPCLPRQSPRICWPFLALFCPIHSPVLDRLDHLLCILPPPGCQIFRFLGPYEWAVPRCVRDELDGHFLFRGGAEPSVETEREGRMISQRSISSRTKEQETFI